LSPQARLIAAQNAYNAQLALAQGGNLDASNSITKYAEDLRTAARDFYGSASGYQTILGQIQSQLLALPAVQQADDPVVVILRDTVTAAINATTSAVNTMRIALQTAVETTNPANIASALSTYFNTLDVNTDGLLDFTEFQTGLHNMASDAALAAMFKTLDTDNSGALSKLELTRIATQGTQAATEGTKIAVDPLAPKVDLTNAKTDEGNLILFQLKVLNQTLTDQFTNIPFISYDIGVNNNMLTALNKIVANTFATVSNTAGIMVGFNRLFEPAQGITVWDLSPNTGAKPSNPTAHPALDTGRVGILAQGGTIPPYGMALVSEHSPGGGHFLRAGPEPIQVFPGSPANDDNKALLERIERALDRLARVAVGVGSEQIDRLDDIKSNLNETSREEKLRSQDRAA
jgi:hypothetical protein